jgi:hypothetical protein
MNNTIKKIVAFGGGVDSSALLAINLHRDKAAELLSITRAQLDEAFPVQDAVMFSDTGWERERTYANVERFEAAYKEAGIPFHRVAREGEDIITWLMRTGTVPLMAGGSHLCSLKFKTEVMHKNAERMFAGSTFHWSIGIEANEDRRANKAFTDRSGGAHTSVYPLRALGLDRNACSEIIFNLTGWVVVKSACVGCPFAQIHEIEDIIRNEPKAWASVKAVEANFRATSPRKFQAWIDGGRKLIKMGKRFRAPTGQWRMDSWANGARLFVKKVLVNGRKIQLSAEEWEARILGGLI